MDVEVSHGVNTDFEDRKYTGLTEKSMTIFCHVSNRCGYGFLERVHENALATDGEGGLLLYFGPASADLCPINLPGLRMTP